NRRPEGRRAPARVAVRVRDRRDEEDVDEHEYDHAPGDERRQPAPREPRAYLIARRDPGGEGAHGRPTLTGAYAAFNRSRQLRVERRLRGVADLLHGLAERERIGEGLGRQRGRIGTIDLDQISGRVAQVE